MEFINIYNLILTLAIVFEYLTFRSTYKELQSFIGLGKLAKLVNDVDFSKDESDYLINYVEKSKKACKNSFIFSCILTIVIVFLNASIPVLLLSLVLVLISFRKHYLIVNKANQVYGLFLMDIGSIRVKGDE